MKLNNLFKKFRPLNDWWFAGVLVIFYWISNNVLGWEGELLEWRTYIFAFIFALVYYLLNMGVQFTFKPVTVATFSVSLYIFIFMDFTLSAAHFIFLIASILLWLGESYVAGNTNIQWQNLGHVIYYFILFHISAKLIYWTDIDDFILSQSQEVPFVVITIFLSSIILMIISLKNHENQQIRLFFLGVGVFFILMGIIFNEYLLSILFSKDGILESSTRIKIWYLDVFLIGLGFLIIICREKKLVWWIIPGILFFAESFSTSGFFDKHGGGAMYHWQPYVGAIEMLDQSGFLLWDTPSTYGFLSIITAYLIPIGDSWQRMYILNGMLRLSFGLLIFKIIWNNKGIFWYLISFGLTFALVFYLPGAEGANSARLPSGGPMRYFWVMLLMYIVVSLREKDLKLQVVFITLVWLIGFLWSVDSAFFVTSVLIPYVLYHIIFNPNKSKNDIKYFIIIPISLGIIVLSISIFYLFYLGTLPDYYAFIEEALENVNGYFSGSINLQGSIIIPLIILSFLLSQIKRNENKHLMFSVWSGLWAVTSYYIGQSDPFDMMLILPILIAGTYLLISLLDKKDLNLKIYNLIPLVTVILTMTYGDLRLYNHIYKTFNNQDYTLKNTVHNEIEDVNQIFTIIKPKDIPVTYIEASRYLNYLSKNEYENVNSMISVKLNNKIWLPLHPATLINSYTLERKVKYIKRWIERHPVEKGWVVMANIDAKIRGAPSYEYFNNIFKIALSDFTIEKRVTHGVLEAILYRRNKILYDE